MGKQQNNKRKEIKAEQPNLPYLNEKNIKTNHYNRRKDAKMLPPPTEIWAVT